VAVMVNVLMLIARQDISPAKQSFVSFTEVLRITNFSCCSYDV
jgi:hypothetical protein